MYIHRVLVNSYVCMYMYRFEFIKQLTADTVNVEKRVTVEVCAVFRDGLVEFLTYYFGLFHSNLQINHLIFCFFS